MCQTRWSASYGVNNNYTTCTSLSKPKNFSVFVAVLRKKQSAFDKCVVPICLRTYKLWDCISGEFGLTTTAIDLRYCRGYYIELVIFWDCSVLHPVINRHFLFLFFFFWYLNRIDTFLSRELEIDTFHGIISLNFRKRSCFSSTSALRLRVKHTWSSHLCAS